MIMPSGRGIGAGVIPCADVATNNARLVTAINLIIQRLPSAGNDLSVATEAASLEPIKSYAGKHRRYQRAGRSMDLSQEPEA
jgi:hypothetical protein